MSRPAATDHQIIAYEAAHAAVEEFCSGPMFQVVVEKAVDTTLQKLGVDTKNPELMRADLAALREWRTTRELIKQKGIITVTGLVVTFMVTALATGVVVILKKYQLI